MINQVKEAISDERWAQTQPGEKAGHIIDPIEISYEKYKIAYSYYFEYLNIDNLNLKQKSVIEIGCARISSLFFCNNYSTSYVIEPTYYPEANQYYEGKNIVKIHDQAEKCNFPKADEVWLFNVLDHVQNPDLIVNKAKQNSKIIRFFEPIDCGTNLEHPFSFTLNDYKKYFGDCVKLYSCPNKEHHSKMFHGSDCAYGVYHV